MIQIDDYFSYFLHQWMNHPELNSDPKGFRLVSVEEALGDFRTNIKEKAYAMRLIEYSHSIVTGESHESRKILQGGFILVAYHKKRSSGEAGYIQARANSERIADEIIAKMVGDSIAGHPLFDYSLDVPDDVHVQPERDTGDGTYSGVLVTFPIANFFDKCIDNVPWKDGGKTPEDTSTTAIAWAITNGGNWKTENVEDWEVTT